MFSFFKSDPLKKLRKQHTMKLEEAFHAQRNGNIRGYSMLSAEAEEIQIQITKLEEGAKSKN